MKEKEKIEEVLSSKQAANYLKISLSTLYKMTSNGDISYYKPNGKLIYIKRTILDNWMLQNKHESVLEMQIQTLKKEENE